MAMKKGGLGRGLDSLFQDTGAQEQADGVQQISINEITPDKDQPRKSFDSTALSELASSIRDHGVLQPIVVRPAPTGGYIIIAGERRWRASRLADLKEVPVVIMDVSNDAAMEIALIENLQREDLDPVEEALGYRQLMERCNYTQEQTAVKVSKSRSAIANSLRILSLPQSVLELLRQNKLSLGHAKVILSLDDPSMQEQAAQETVEKGLNVRDIEALCKKLKRGEKQKREILRPSIAGEVEISLREVLGLNVKVKYKDGEGQMTIPFFSDEQLKELANLLGKYEKEKTKGDK